MKTFTYIIALLCLIVSTRVKILAEKTPSCKAQFLKPVSCKEESFEQKQRFTKANLQKEKKDTLTKSSNTTIQEKISPATKTIFNTLIIETCAGDTIFFAGKNISKQGIYYDTISKENTDSILSLQLIINPTHIIENSTTICSSDSIKIGGRYTNTPGIYTDTLKTTLGCDSIVKTTLHTTNAFKTDKKATICANGTYLSADKTIKEQGTYTDTLQSKAGCDSIVTLTLHQEPHYERDTIVYLCPGSQYFAGGKLQTDEGRFVDTLLSQTQCDSIVWTQLMKANDYRHTFAQFICIGDSVEINGTYIKEDYTFKIIHKNSYGCDSSISYNIQLLPSYEIEEDIEICEGETYFAEGKKRSTKGAYYDTLQTEMGCDSILITNVTVHPKKKKYITKHLCKGSSLPFAGSDISKPGTYIETHKTATGCDSIVYMNVAVFDNDNIQHDTITICTGAWAEINGKKRNKEGIYYDTITLADNCRGILVSNLQTLPTYTTYAYYALCKGERIYANGDYRYKSDTYGDTLKAQNGCDSIVTWKLDFKQPTKTTRNVSICQGETFYAQGLLQFETGQYTDTLKSIAECDSIIVTNLSVLPSSYCDIKKTICQGDTIFFENTYITEAGSYTHTTQNHAGCDSIITLHAEVAGQHISPIEITVCGKKSYNFNGKNLHQSGIYLDTLQSKQGCDSIIYLDLVFSEALKKKRTITLCKGETIVMHNAEIHEAGIYIDTIKNSQACDTIIETTVTIDTYLKIEYHVEICEGDSVFAGNSFQTQAGVFYDTIPSSNGCDTIQITHITINKPVHTLNKITICKGNSYTVKNTAYTKKGSYSDTLTASNGCDSIVHTHLLFYPDKEKNTTIYLCKGDSTLIDGKWISDEGKYTQQHISRAGCDSTVNTYVIKNTYVEKKQTIKACYGDTLFMSNGFATEPGIYYDTITSRNSCDTIYTYNLILKNNYELLQQRTICTGDSIMLEGSYQNESGTYFDTTVCKNACDTVTITELIVADKYHITKTINICEGDTLRIGKKQYTTTDTIRQKLQSKHGCDSVTVSILNVWPAHRISIDTLIYRGDSIAFIDMFVKKERYYIDTIKNSNNCDSIITLNLKVITNNPPKIKQIKEQTISYINPILSFNLNEISEDDHTADSLLKWTISPSNNFIISISEKNIVTITVKNKKWQGADTIIFTVEDDGKKKGEMQMAIKSTGTNTAVNLPDGTTIIATPLPNKQKFHIQYQSYTPQKATISLQNHNKETLQSKKISIASQPKSTYLKIKRFTSNTYFLKIELETHSSTHELIMTQ